MHEQEKQFVMACIIFGAFLYAYIIGDFSNLLSNLSHERDQYDSTAIGFNFSASHTHTTGRVWVLSHDISSLLMLFHFIAVCHVGKMRSMNDLLAYIDVPTETKYKVSKIFPRVC